MFILGDETKHRGIPWITGGLVLVNLAVFLLQLAIGEAFTRGYSLVPAEIVSGKDLTKPAPLKIKEIVRDRYSRRLRYEEVTVMVPQARGPRPIQLTLLTSMFMHGSWLHLIGNIWFLLVFGRNVELAMGRQLFVWFYLTCGVVSGLADVLVSASSVVPYLGASGAISGIMGAYFFIYPLNKIKVWLAYFYVVEAPTFVVIGLWFLIQYFSTVFAVTSGQIHTGTAYWSHIGGFITGIAFILVTLAILKYQQKLAEQRAALEEDAALEETEADRLFAKAEEAKSEAVTADPYKSFLPPGKREPVTSVRSDEYR
jgi:membrane associated rhomboid family serine protease